MRRFPKGDRKALWSARGPKPLLNPAFREKPYFDLIIQLKRFPRKCEDIKKVLRESCLKLARDREAPGAGTREGAPGETVRKPLR